MRVIYLSPSPAWREWNRSSRKALEREFLIKAAGSLSRVRLFFCPDSLTDPSKRRENDQHIAALMICPGRNGVCVAEGKTGIVPLLPSSMVLLNLVNASFGLTSGTMWPVVRSRLILLTGAGIDTAQVYIKKLKGRKPWVWGLFLMH